MTSRGPHAAGLPLATLLFALAAGACGRDAPAAGTGGGDPVPARADAVVDAAGRSHAAGAPPERVLSLVPSATETLVALGAGDLLVGRTDHDTEPAVAALPSVGGGLQPDLETLLSLRPDLVVRFAGPSDPGTPERLDAAGIAHFAVRPDGVADVRAMIEGLGALVARRDEAAALVARIDERLAGVRARVAGRAPVRVAYLLGGSPPWVAGPGTFIHELMVTAGGVNVFGDLGDLYAPVSVEELFARDVDLFVVAAGAELDPRVRGGVPVREAPGGLETPGPHLGVSAEAMARLLHPDAVP